MNAPGDDVEEAARGLDRLGVVFAGRGHVLGVLQRLHRLELGRVARRPHLYVHVQGKIKTDDPTSLDQSTNDGRTL